MIIPILLLIITYFIRAFIGPIGVILMVCGCMGKIASYWCGFIDYYMEIQEEENENEIEENENSKN